MTMTADQDLQAELRALQEDNEALRYASLAFGDLADRLSLRIRELERRVRFFERLLSATRVRSVNLACTGMPGGLHALGTSRTERLPGSPNDRTPTLSRRSA